jgi:hypothetical protein
VLDGGLRSALLEWLAAGLRALAARVSAAAATGEQLSAAAAAPQTAGPDRLNPSGGALAAERVPPQHWLEHLRRAREHDAIEWLHVKDPRRPSISRGTSDRPTESWSQSAIHIAVPMAEAQAAVKSGATIPRARLAIVPSPEPSGVSAGTRARMGSVSRPDAPTSIDQSERLERRAARDRFERPGADGPSANVPAAQMRAGAVNGVREQPAAMALADRPGERVDGPDWPMPVKDGEHGAAPPPAGGPVHADTPSVFPHGGARRIYSSPSDAPGGWPEIAAPNAPGSSPWATSAASVDARLRDERAGSVLSIATGRRAQTAPSAIPFPFTAAPSSRPPANSSESSPGDLTGCWPELLAEPTSSDRENAEQQWRAFERRRRLDAEQRGTRWNA